MDKLIRSLLIVALFSLFFMACGHKPMEEANQPLPTFTPSPVVTPTVVTPTSTPNPYGTINNSTYYGKVIIGYQGWFRCPGEGSEYDSWDHWFEGPPSIQNFNVDFWPDVSELTEDELCDTGFKDAQGNPMYAFTSYNPLTVLRHFKWMGEYGIDGVELERFASVMVEPVRGKDQDKVLENVLMAAETYGRVFYIQYDGIEKGNMEAIKEDWMDLVDEMGLTSSPAYLHHNGLPVVGFFGIGFKGRGFTPEEAQDLIDFFKHNPNPKYRATILGGVPTYWRTLSTDSATDPAWTGVYHSLDIINPWHVNSIYDNSSADWVLQNVIIPDLEETRNLGIDYMPVILPGFSWNNMMGDGYNKTPRDGGTFLWKLAYNLIAQDVDMIMIAMFDEVDEGTAIFKLVETSDQLPEGDVLIPLDVDGYPLPNDWYLLLAGRITQMLRGEVPLTQEIPDLPVQVFSNYLHVFLEFTTGGDWNSLTFLNPDVIYNIRVLSTKGEFTNLSVTPSVIMMNQSLEDARAGKQVTMVAEVYLNPAAGFDTLEILLEKGSIGTATLRFYTMVDGVETTVLEVNHSLTNDIAGKNPYQTSLLFSLLE